ncbi:hypothetical protein L2E82_22932 [Cichorium intybus]|uniref:Uncharacterized protein n=1 Tax=Cichorium intybus TaxID=13427 RepID=A0ACB9E061_CICIN|nr:hypothetical protein L2E82_22932 [Cichorium intybus]
MQNDSHVVDSDGIVNPYVDVDLIVNENEEPFSANSIVNIDNTNCIDGISYEKESDNDDVGSVSIDGNVDLKPITEIESMDDDGIRNLQETSNPPVVHMDTIHVTMIMDSTGVQGENRFDNQMESAELNQEQNKVTMSTDFVGGQEGTAECDKNMENGKEGKNCGFDYSTTVIEG